MHIYNKTQAPKVLKEPQNALPQKCSTKRYIETNLFLQWMMQTPQFGNINTASSPKDATQCRHMIMKHCPKGILKRRDTNTWKSILKVINILSRAGRVSRGGSWGGERSRDGGMWTIVVFCWLLNIPATCECISGTDLLRQFQVLPHWDTSCRPNFPFHPVTVYWTQANQSQQWPPYNARRLAG